jgi:hypothetical protein
MVDKSGKAGNADILLFSGRAGPPERSRFRLSGERLGLPSGHDVPNSISSSLNSSSISSSIGSDRRRRPGVMFRA